MWQKEESSVPTHGQLSALRILRARITELVRLTAAFIDWQYLQADEFFVCLFCNVS